ncbi:MAG: sigma 54-interacting transcriptional regulator [Desulfovibrio sp.]|jgi:PAS domain S-box-containing protein|nr:sigma 54-interacting transcriptional regulator [Desulfovibrio sp.]
MDNAPQKRILELENQVRHLRRRNLIYEQAVSAIADGFFIVERDGTVVEMNKAYCEYLGVRREETIGKHISDVIYNTKMIDIMETHVTEIDSLHQFEDGQTATGEKMIAVSRMPVMDGDEVIAAVALVKFSRYTITLANKLRKLEEEVAYYRKELRKRGLSSLSPAEIPCASPALAEVKRLALRFAANDLPLLLIGETGVGKNIFAHAVHCASERRDGPFISVNCSSLPADLLETEFFGHADGASRDGKKGVKNGKFEMANNGTLFLDEIGDLPLPLQGKLLRVLQTQEMEKQGLGRTIPVNVRIIAATNQDLNRKAESKLFRPDLLYRLNVLTITIPPLRDRREDIPVLADHFLAELNAAYGRSVALAPDALFALTRHDWPGNARELRNAIGRAFMLTETRQILPCHLPLQIDARRGGEKRGSPDSETRREKELLISSLTRYNGNMSKAAKALGIHRSTLYTKLAALGISGKTFRARAAAGK